MDGDWSLARVKVTDGQLTEHILEDVNGVLNLNFNAGKSDGFSIFDLNTVSYTHLTLPTILLV